MSRSLNHSFTHAGLAVSTVHPKERAIFQKVKPSSLNKFFNTNTRNGWTFLTIQQKNDYWQIYIHMIQHLDIRCNEDSHDGVFELWFGLCQLYKQVGDQGHMTKAIGCTTTIELVTLNISHHQNNPLGYQCRFYQMNCGLCVTLHCADNTPTSCDQLYDHYTHTHNTRSNFDWTFLGLDCSQKNPLIFTKKWAWRLDRWQKSLLTSWPKKLQWWGW